MTDQHAMRKYHFLIAFFVVFLDRLAKWAVERNISLHESIPIIPGFFRLTHLENRGAAFGLFADSPSEWKVAGLLLFSVGGLGVGSALLWENSHALSSTGVGVSFIFGGARGNPWERPAARP